jgi:hypothetical protein
MKPDLIAAVSGAFVASLGALGAFIRQLRSK